MHIKQITHLFIVFLSTFLVVSCSSYSPVEEPKTGWDLVKIDSFSVDFGKEVHGVAFNGQKGVFYHFKDVSLTQFDTTGTILRTTFVEEDGPNALGYVVGMLHRPDGSLLLQSLNGEIGLLDSTLTFSQKILMPFQSTLPAMRSNVKSMASQENEVFVYFPGRNGANPYEKNYFKNNYLLERINLSTGTINPVYKLAIESKFQEDTYHDTPYILVSIFEEELYFVLDNEPVIHIYQLENGDFPLQSIPLEAKKFIQVTPNPIPLGNMDGVYPAVIDGLFGFDGGFAVTYGEGLEKEEVDRQPMVDPRLLKSLQRNLLKFFTHQNGWSNEIEIPREVSEIIHFKSTESYIYGLKNTAYQSSDAAGQVTIYKLALTPKES
ncbi:MAG: hypothetical protein JJU34_01155 [Lunatimonas sp.]|uniref:hypothetical protein n=1 Tax=Lunatimonas sp. TaxID=2060141 RepID=UPI00263B91EE|nr:hypothetical protein [Lunatimonas sp.]MCC5935864.1 hypothetical protein [Lunatimonas sp.]